MKPYLPRKIATYATGLFLAASFFASCSSGIETKVNPNQEATVPSDGGVVNQHQEINYNIHIHTQCPDGTYEKNQSSTRSSTQDKRPSSPSQKEPQPESSQPSGDQQPTIDDTVREENTRQQTVPEQRSSSGRSSSSYTPSQTTSSGCPDHYQAPRKDVSYRTGFKPVGTSTCGGEYQRSMEERHANYQNQR